MSITLQPTLEVIASYGYASDLQYGQDSAGTYGPVYATENGIDTVNLLDGSFPPAALPHGATASGSWSISSAVQHFSMSAVSSGYGLDDPTQKADDGYSSVDVAIQAIDTDYITNTSNLPKTILFSYTLDTVSAPTGLLDQAGCAWQVDPYPNPGGKLVGAAGTIDFVPSHGAGIATYQFTVAPGETVSWYQNYQFQGSAGWAYDPPPGPGFTGYPLSYDASDTGTIHADELDSDGKPVPGNPDLTFASGIDFSSVACFATGTRIAVPGGAVPVERLVPGDRVVAKLGGVSSVVWVGHRRLDCRRHPRPNEVWPIHIAAHAFAPGSPSRALRLSPDHAVFTGEVLIPVRYLVNGSTIAQVETDRVTYWHVELAQHDILLAENLPCESYLDTGNRDAFDNAPNFYNSSSAETASAPLPSAAHAAASAPASVTVSPQ